MLTSLDIPAALTLLFLYIIKLILILDILKKYIIPSVALADSHSDTNSTCVEPCPPLRQQKLF